MRAEEILQLWERAEGLGPVERALALAEAAGADGGRLRERPLGWTNAQILSLREDLSAGRELSATASCPACHDRVEFSVDPQRLQALHRDPGPPGPAASGPEICGPMPGAGPDDVVVRWHSPTPADLAAAATAEDPEDELRRRCLSARTPDGAAVDPATLPAELIEAVEAAMAQADPLAEVVVTLECPACAGAFDADLDLGSYVWAELDARARRLLHDVDILARAYGWTEPEVLALGETRRAAYLRLVLDGAP